MDLTLPQALLLLSLNDQKGTTEAGYFQPAFAGAELAELLLQGTLELQEDPPLLIPLRHSKELGALLKMCDETIGRAPKHHDIAYWVSALANQKDFVATLADELCHLGALSKDRTRIFGLFSRTVWPSASPALETELKQAMVTAMFHEVGPVEERLGLVIAFAESVDLLKHNFDPHLLSQHAERIQAISAGACLKSDTAEAVVRSVQQAISMANAVSTSTIAGIVT